MRKIQITLLFLLLTLSSCGPNIAPSSETNNIDNLAVNGSSQYIDVLINVPNPNFAGGVLSIKYQNKNYLLGANTENWIKNEINNWSPGIYSKRIQGSINRETGYFPNPTAFMDVIHVSNIE